MRKNSPGQPVLITYNLPREWTESLTGITHPITAPLEARGFSDPLFQRLADDGYKPSDVQGVLTMLTDQVDETLLVRLPSLKVVSNMAVGVDNIDIASCTMRGIPVGHTPGVLTDATADLAMALLLSAARRIPETNADAAAGKWKNWIPDRWLGADLNGGKLGIVGMGKIGLAIARRAKAFGMEVGYHNRNPNPQAESDLDAKYLHFDELLASSDFIIAAVSLNETSRGLFDKLALRAMKPNAILVNISRGPVVVTNDLVEALRTGQIQAAALDVTDPEPLPPDHPLYHLPNCLITPHIGSATHATRQGMARLACKNLLAGLASTKLPHCVNPEVYE